MREKKGQSAVEFMMIVGIAFTLMIPSLFMFQQFSSQSSELVISDQINSFGREVISAVESMYYYGESAKATLSFNAPDNIEDMRINPLGEDSELSEFIITADVYGSETDFVFFTKVPIIPEDYGSEEYSSDLSAGIEPRIDAFTPGMKRYSIEAVKDDSLMIRIRRVRND